MLLFPLIFLSFFALHTALYKGHGTYYGGNVHGGACGFSKSWPGWTPVSKGYTAAINGAQWNSSLNCGRCALVRNGNRKPIMIQIVDVCFECSHGSLDFAPVAWNAIMQARPNRLPITWDFVECAKPFVSGNVNYGVKEGSSKYWVAFQPQNFAIGIAKVELKSRSEAKWIVLSRDDSKIRGLYFVHHKNFDDTFFQLRTTSVKNSVITSPVFRSLSGALNCGDQFGMHSRHMTRARGSNMAFAPALPRVATQKQIRSR